MEMRILDEVAQVAGLKLVSLEAECRATICRVKLVHPPGTNALTSLRNLVSMAIKIGFAHVVHRNARRESGADVGTLFPEAPVLVGLRPMSALETPARNPLDDSQRQ
jgi:hypothetical protein